MCCNLCPKFEECELAETQNEECCRECVEYEYCHEMDPKDNYKERDRDEGEDML